MIEAHRTLVFAPRYNTKGRKDATGAFIPEAKRFAEHHGIGPEFFHLIDNSKSKAAMRREVDAAISTYDGEQLRGVAFFCHGYKRGMQLGFDNKTVNQLASAIGEACHPSVRVPLYACDAARDTDRDRKDDLEVFGGNGGFADQLRDALCNFDMWDCVVWAHTTAGHTTKNPNVRVFPGMGSPVGGTGGFYLVHKKQNRDLWRAWYRALRETDLRFDFPFMEVAEIHRYLQTFAARVGV